MSLTGGLQPRTGGFSLRELRHERGLSLRKVEELVGISRATLSRAERGIEIPNPGVIHALSRLYEVDPHDWSIVIEYRALVERPPSRRRARAITEAGTAV